ncbi:MAG: ATP-binding protein, partial [Chloroflexota bacterium]
GPSMAPGGARVKRVLFDIKFHGGPQSIIRVGRALRSPYPREGSSGSQGTVTGIGLISTDNYYSKKPLRPYIVDLMALYGTTVGHLITRKRAELDIERYVEQLHLVQQVDRSIRFAEQPETIAQEIVRPLKDILNCHLVDIIKYEPKTALFSEVARSAENLDHNLFPFQIDHASLQHLSGQKQIVHENFESLDSEIQIFPQSLIDDWINQGVCANTIIPLFDKDVLIGCIIIGLSEAGRLNDEQSEIAHQVATQLSIAVHQTRLYRKLQLYATDLEDLVKQRTAQLNYKAEELEAFTYSVSHDLRSPLRAIDGFSRTLISKYKDELPSKAQHYLNRVQFNAVRMGMMIDDLLDLSRVGRREFIFDEVDLNELIQDILSELKINNQLGNAEIEVAALPACSGDKNLLRLALFNLISNAIKYSQKVEQPKIVVDFYTSETGVPVYRITDNGVGFDMKYIDKLFGVFQRLHTNREYEGNGIGLATVRRIIEKHEGKVWAEATVNQGATFFFTFNK